MVRHNRERQLDLPQQKKITYEKNKAENGGHGHVGGSPAWSGAAGGRAPSGVWGGSPMATRALNDQKAVDNRWADGKVGRRNNQTQANKK